MLCLPPLHCCSSALPSFLQFWFVLCGWLCAGIRYTPRQWPRRCAEASILVSFQLFQQYMLISAPLNPQPSGECVWSVLLVSGCKPFCCDSLCVFYCVCMCVSSALCLWFFLPSQAEMVSCGSEPLSWKSSSENRVQIWPLHVRDLTHL